MFDTLYNTIDMLLPFQWLSHTFMKNAFIADYLAQQLIHNGMTNGYIAAENVVADLK